MRGKIVSLLLCAFLVCSAAAGAAPANAADETTSAASAITTEDGKVLTPIEGIDGAYIWEATPDFLLYIVDKNGEMLSQHRFRWIDSSLNEYGTLEVRYAVGMMDSAAGLLSRELKDIVPYDTYTDLRFFEQNDKVYANVWSFANGERYYYDLDGNKVTLADIFANSDHSCSSWAENSIWEAASFRLVPQELQSAYTEKITRQEFCRLAMQMYAVKTGTQFDESAASPFSDVDDTAVTAAYNLNIVSGVGSGKFAPLSYITRQEAAVMLSNLASALEITGQTPRSGKFADESYFASWAKTAIYRVAGMQGGDTCVMVGTGSGKFSPWMNFTREQAIATMLRMYHCAMGY